MIGSIGNSIPISQALAQQRGQQQSPAAEATVKGPEDAQSELESNPAFQAVQGSSETSNNSTLSNELTEEEEKQVEELKERDQEVRTHENAHKSAGGGYVGAISYETVTGPDGREYAIGGEAQIDASPISGNPEATIRKMDIIVRAALAPAEPSSQDFAVARAAQAARLQAQQELREQEQLEQSESAQNINLALLNEENSQEQNTPNSIDFSRASDNLQRAQQLSQDVIQTISQQIFVTS